MSRWMMEPRVDDYELVQPPDLSVGDVVQVEHPGPPPWLLRGTVLDVANRGPRDVWVSFKPGGELLMPHDAFIRRLQRAEPEPDPEQVEALTQILHNEISGTGLLTRNVARELARRGVTVREQP